MIKHLWIFTLACILSIGLLNGCSGSDEAVQVIEKIDIAPAEELRRPPKLTTAERVGLSTMQTEAPQPAFSWTTPEGWVEQPGSAMRMANFSFGESSECYFTLLGGDGGGLAANLNRWRGQMGLEPYTIEEIADLPKRPIFGTEGILTIMDGAYGGMSGGAGEPDYRMVGLTLIAQGQAFFVKMIGPRAEVEAQQEAFENFCATLEVGLPEDDAHAGHNHAPGEGHDNIAPEATESVSDESLPEGHPPVAPMPEADAVPASNLKWAVPQGWVEGEPRMMREVTLQAGTSECYVSRLSGTAGGTEANINRWCGQMGLEPLGAAEFGALETIPAFSQSVPYVVLKGDYTGMGGDKKPGYVMLGVVAPVEGETFFVKMIGPEAEVLQQEENFKAFCQSLSIE